MLRVTNRNISSTRQGKKQDNLELCTIVDRCTQILRDDRIQLRILLKEQQNQKLIEILQRYRRRGSLDDLSDLQIELRRFINEQKGRKLQTSPEGRDFIKKRTVQKENINSPPPAQRQEVNVQSDRKISNISQASEKSQGSIKKRSFVSLQRNVDIFDPPASDTDHTEGTPSKCDQLQFMTIVSQSPHTSIIKDSKDTDLKESTNRSQEVLLKYNVEEINAFREPQDTCQQLSFTECPKCKENEQVRNLTGNDVFPSVLPNLQSLNYRLIASPEYRGLFTDWTSLLNSKEKNHYQLAEKTELDLGWVRSNEVSQVCESYKVAVPYMVGDVIVANQDPYLPRWEIPQEQRRHYEYTIYT